MTQALRVYEFAVERGFSFDYVEVTAVSLPWARAKLHDELTVEQRESATSIELCSERPARRLAELFPHAYGAA